MLTRCYSQADTAAILGWKRCEVRKVEKSVLEKFRRALGIRKNHAIIGRPLLRCGK